MTKVKIYIVEGDLGPFSSVSSGESGTFHDFSQFENVIFYFLLKIA